MKSDKPFQKGLICGSTLCVITFLFLLALFRTQEFYFVKYVRVFIACFLPTTLAAIWGFCSKKNWTWARFIIITIIFYPICLILLMCCKDFLPEETPALPAISFSPEISSSWIIEIGHPITNVAGKPIGSQLLLKNVDRRREIWVEACNSYNDFDTNVAEWRGLMTTRFVQSGFHLQEHTFSLDTKGGRKVAVLHFRGHKDDLTRGVICKGWMQKRFFVTCEAMGENVEIANDNEIADIISRMVVK